MRSGHIRSLRRIFGVGAGSAGRGNESARAGGFAARALAEIGYLCGAGVDRGSARMDEWIFGIRTGSEVDSAQAEATVFGGGAFSSGVGGVSWR